MAENKETYLPNKKGGGGETDEGYTSKLPSGRTVPHENGVGRVQQMSGPSSIQGDADDAQRVNVAVPNETVPKGGETGFDRERIEKIATIRFQPTEKEERGLDIKGNAPPTSNAGVYSIVSNLAHLDMSPNTVLAHIGVNKNRLESVGIYKTVDLITEGAIAGFCDAKGNLISLSDSSQAANLDAFKGIYFNDMPVRNTNNNTFNYQRVHAEVRYGTFDQPLLSDNSKQAGLSYLQSCQTFSIDNTLPGFNKQNWNRFANRLGSNDHQINIYHNLKADTIAETERERVDYSYKAWNKEWGKMGGAASQFCFTNNMANMTSIYADEVDNNKIMIQRFRDVFVGFSKGGESNAGHPVIFHHAITNDNVSAVEINLMTQTLYFRDITPGTDDSEPGNNTIIFLMKIGYEDSDKLLGAGGDTYYVLAPITGVATSPYARSYTLPLPIPTQMRDRVVSICVVSEEPTPEQRALGGVQRKGGVQSLTEVVNAPLAYPHSAIVASIVDARSFSRVPKRSYDLKLIKVNIPSNYDSEDRSYLGNWTGQFAINKQWSNNPAWVFYDMLINKRYGLSKYGFGENIVDKWNLYSIGKYCDELVETGFQPAQFPLDFTINKNGATVYIQDDPDDPWGYEELKGMFPYGDPVSFYKLKNANGENVGQGFRRRIGARSYNEQTNVFQFNIHKIINPGYVFGAYRAPHNGSQEGTTGLDYQYAKANERNEGEPISEREWLFQHLNDQSKLAIGNRDRFAQDYSAGWTLGHGVASGKVVLDSSIRRPVLEPRFATNIYLDREQDAYNCLNDLAAVFRGMVYWNNGFVFISNDQAREAVMVFTNANVQEGVFTYTGSAKTTRFTSVLIRYNDEYDNFKPKVEYIEDPASIRKYGYLEKKLVGLGTTSRSQAYRLGKWFLFTNQLETDLVQFKTGIEASYLRPGDVVKIQDSLKNSKRYGGRIKAMSPRDFQLTLDKGIEENIVGQKITLVVPRDSTPIQQLNTESEQKIKSNDYSGISQTEMNETRAPQIQEFTIVDVGPSDPEAGGVQNDLITVEKDSENFDSVTTGTIWSIQNLNADYQIKEVEYRILSVVEQTAGNYEVTAMMYAKSKFGAIDESRNLMATQQSKSQFIKSVIVQSPSLDGSVDVEMAELVPVSEGGFTVGDADESREIENRDKTKFVVNFSNKAKEIIVDLAADQFVSKWYVSLRTSGWSDGPFALESIGTPESEGWVEAPTYIEVFLGNTLDIKTVSYHLSYDVMGKTDSGYTVVSWGQDVYPADGWESYQQPGG